MRHTKNYVNYLGIFENLSTYIKNSNFINNSINVIAYRKTKINVTQYIISMHFRYY